MVINTIEVGLFNDINSLFAYLDDQLILFENSGGYKSTFIIFDDKHEREQTKEFLLANHYNLNKKTTQQLEVIFSKSDLLTDKEHIFFINTEFVVYENSNIVDLANEIDKSSMVAEVHFLNSNSYFDYYQKFKEHENVDLIGSSAKPMKMTNNCTPF